MTLYPFDHKGRSLRCIVFMLVLIAGLSTGVVSCQKQEKPSGPPDKVTIAYVTTSHGYFLFDIACAKGFFTLRRDILDGDILFDRRAGFH